MPFIPAAIGGIASAIGGAAAGAASVIGSAASAVAGAAGSVIGGAAGLVGGGISALTGGQAAVPVMAGGEMGSLAAASEVAALGVPAATTAATGLASLTSAVGAGVGIYGTLKQIEIAEKMTETQKIQAQEALIQAEALKIQKETPAPAPLPTLTRQPLYITAPAVSAKPNYLLYAGIAVLAFMFLRKK